MRGTVAIVRPGEPALLRNAWEGRVAAALPGVLVESGYQFRHPEIGGALARALGRTA